MSVYTQTPRRESARKAKRIRLQSMLWGCGGGGGGGGRFGVFSRWEMVVLLLGSEVCAEMAQTARTMGSCFLGM